MREPASKKKYRLTLREVSHNKILRQWEDIVEMARRVPKVGECSQREDVITEVIGVELLDD